jgi:hypothetical protein
LFVTNRTTKQEFDRSVKSGVGRSHRRRIPVAVTPIRRARRRATGPKPEIGQPITVDEVRRHAECMRAHGFDVPDPTEGPGRWRTIIDDPEADMSSPDLPEPTRNTSGR